jgi:hypothetical protein
VGYYETDLDTSPGGSACVTLPVSGSCADATDCTSDDNCPQNFVCIESCCPTNKCVEFITCINESSPARMFRRGGRMGARRGIEGRDSDRFALDA